MIGETEECSRNCTKCGKIKPLSDFGNHRHCAKGKNPVCRPCRKIKSRKDYDNTSKEKRIYHRAKYIAKANGLFFDLEISDIVIPKFCPVFGVELIYGDTDWTPSIDRLIPAKGYVKDNIRIISNKANRLKNDSTLEELLQIIAYLEREVKLPKVYF
jgi:hypothetical protein